jgi:hypothetical protein
MTLQRVHDRIVALEGVACSCPDDCDALYAARLRLNRERGTDGQLELGDEAKPVVGQLGVDHDDWGGY